MTGLTPDRLLHPLIAQATGRRPMRAWSIIVSIFGDVALPVGGRMAMSSLVGLTGRMGIDAGVVRVAAHRLVRDGTLARERDGRRSLHALTADGRALFAEAERKIYGPLHPAAAGPWRVALAANAGRSLGGSDFPAANGWALLDGGVAAIGKPCANAKPGADAILLETQPSPADAQRLAFRAWRLGDLAARYARLDDLLVPLLAHVPDEPVDCMLMRVLAIHEYRRIALNDPGLPVEALPAGWPGLSLRRTIATLYANVTPRAGRWLAGQDGFGPVGSETVGRMAGRFSPG